MTMTIPTDMRRAFGNKIGRDIFQPVASFRQMSAQAGSRTPSGRPGRWTSATPGAASFSTT
ncbi:hypothetical protein [Sorangium cellulosum]|uniref:hypothetical protein n=1 Tax=Sorangium cellulosum TaxID=56 RepID=UPI0011DDD388|nr:hypothetical protein [Sorangium cellulosum]